jgi:hypothetical protein
MCSRGTSSISSRQTDGTADVAGQLEARRTERTPTTSNQHKAEPRTEGEAGPATRGGRDGEPTT